MARAARSLITRGRAIVAVMLGFVVLPATAAPASAQPLTQRAQASASGGFAVTPVATARTVLRPGQIQFRVAASPPQHVEVDWSVLCFSATAATVDRDGVRTLSAPGTFTPQLPARTYRSDDCQLLAFASFASTDIGGTLTVSIWASTRPAPVPLPRLLVDLGGTFRVRPATIDIGNVLVTGPAVTKRDIRAGRYGRLRWTRWTRNEARARGRIWIPTGPPGVPNYRRPLRPFLINFRAYRVRNRRYTRLWYAYTVRGRRQQTWNNLIRSGGHWIWRVTRFTGPRHFL